MLRARITGKTKPADYRPVIHWGIPQGSFGRTPVRSSSSSSSSPGAGSSLMRPASARRPPIRARTSRFLVRGVHRCQQLRHAAVRLWEGDHKPPQFCCDQVRRRPVHAPLGVVPLRRRATVGPYGFPPLRNFVPVGDMPTFARPRARSSARSRFQRDLEPIPIFCCLRRAFHALENTLKSPCACVLAARGVGRWCELRHRRRILQPRRMPRGSRPPKPT